MTCVPVPLSPLLCPRCTFPPPRRPQQYMLALDDDTFIDATRKGNISRYFNHSCAPNCYMRVVSAVSNLLIRATARRVARGRRRACAFTLPCTVSGSSSKKKWRPRQVATLPVLRVRSRRVQQCTRVRPYPMQKVYRKL